jgi:hypothetical protein
MKTEYVIKLQGETYTCLTLGGLGKLCNRQPRSIRRLIEQDVLAPPNIRMPSKEIKGVTVNGVQLYTEDCAIELAKVIKEEIIPRQKIKDSTRAKLWRIVKSEKEKFQ